MIRPRNTFCVLRLIEKSNRKMGSIVMPTLKEEFCEAEVIAVGPGNIAAEGGRSDTYDLKPGQLVFVKHKVRNPRGELSYAGVPYRAEGNTYFLFDQNSVLGIVADTCEGVEAFTELGGANIAVPSKTLLHA